MKTHSRGFASIAVLGLGLFLVAVGGIILNAQNTEHQTRITALHERLQKQEEQLRVGAFRPSGYVGKLLTRLNEGGSESSFNTTPGTAADDSTLTTAKIGDFVVLTINPGADNEEKISASAVSVSGTTATWTIVNRGLSFTENVAVTANKKQHSIGETVIISNDDHYLDVQYGAIDEDVTITGSWSFPTPTIGANAATKTYVDGAAFGGIGNASETATGTVEIATQTEAASSTSSGSLGRLVIPASSATSTYNADTAALRVPVTSNDGFIDQGFLPAIITKALSLSGTITYSGGATTFASSSILAYASTTPTSTWTKPANLKYIKLKIQGAGGQGGTSGGTTGHAGGGGGGYGEKIIPAAALGATETVTVSGHSSITTSFGTHCTVASGSDANGTAGGAGSSAVGCDFSVTGGSGSNTVFVATNLYGGDGGNSVFGQGGRGCVNGSASANDVGDTGTGYGGGGGGSCSATDGNPTDPAKGQPAPGYIIVEQYFY